MQKKKWETRKFVKLPQDDFYMLQKRMWTRRATITLDDDEEAEQSINGWYYLLMYIQSQCVFVYSSFLLCTEIKLI